MQTQERAFLQNYRRYNDFRRANIIPSKIEHKLEYLAKTILNDMEISQEIRQAMDRDEVDALDTLDHNTKLQLFVSISDCLLGKSSPTEAVQAYLRRDKYLSSWELCYVSHDFEHLYITTDKKQCILMDDIKVLKGLRQKSDKWLLTLEINKATMLLGFTKERQAYRLYQLLIQPGRQRTMNAPTIIGVSHIRESELSFNKTHVKRKFTSVKQVVHERPTQNIPTEKTDSIDSSGKEISMEDICEQLTHIQKQLCEQFKLDGLLEDDGYRIEEVLRNGRILVSEEKPDICKLCMTLQSNNFHQILNSFSHITKWNTQVQESKIVSRVQPNSYIYYERLKSHGLTSRQRDFVFLRQGVRIRDRVHLLDRSVQHASFPPGRRVVRGSICKRTITLIPHQDNKKLTLLVIRMDIDHSGYSNTSDANRHASVRVLKGFAALNQFIEQKSINIPDLLYNFEKPPQQIKIPKQKKKQVPKFIELRTEAKEPLKSMENIDFQMSRNFHLPQMTKSQIFTKSTDENTSKDQVIHIKTQPMQQKVQQNKLVQEGGQTLNELMMSYEWERPTEQYLNLISKQKQHQSIYLKHIYKFGDLDHETQLHKNNPGTDNFVFQNGDWIFNQNNEFVFVNEKVIGAQKDVLKYVIRKIGTNLISGKSIMNMSLPVQIFDARGLLQRSAASFGFAPIFLGRAASTDNLLEQMKFVITYMLSINILELRSEKPFNPILGETFQGYLGKTPICYEQISHHPPISAYYMKNEDFEMYGNLVSFAELGLNSGVGGNLGIINIKFSKSGAHYQCSLPSCEISGLVFGERKLKFINKGFILNRQNGMMAEINLGRDKKDLYPSGQKMCSSDIAGGIFTVTDIFVKKYLKATHKHRFEGLSSKDVLEKLCTIEGAWNGDIKIGGQVYKRLLEPAPYQVEYEKVPLPSNSNYREDIIQRRLDNLAMSQQAKEFLEDRQRMDKKLRGHK